ncbi:MAG: helix-turn-helix domain-containing protein [Bilophila wadsworthia]
MKPENVVDVLFGNRLRQLLDERNISQAHFADRIGVSRSRMNNYVAQRSEPDYATLIRIANTLDTSIDFLLGKSEHQGLPQTACLSGFPDFIPSRGAGGEPPDPSCWIPLYGSQYEARNRTPPQLPLRSGPHGRASALPVNPLRGFATRRRQAFPLHMKIGGSGRFPAIG